MDIGQLIKTHCKENKIRFYEIERELFGKVEQNLNTRLKSKQIKILGQILDYIGLEIRPKEGELYTIDQFITAAKSLKNNNQKIMK